MAVRRQEAPVAQFAIDNLWNDVISGYGGGLGGITSLSVTDPSVNGIGLVRTIDSNGSPSSLVFERCFWAMSMATISSTPPTHRSCLPILARLEPGWTEDVNYDAFVDAGDATVVFAMLGSSFDPAFAPAAAAAAPETRRRLVGQDDHLIWPGSTTPATGQQDCFGPLSAFPKPNVVGNFRWDLTARGPDAQRRLAPPIRIVVHQVHERGAGPGAACRRCPHLGDRLLETRRVRSLLPQLGLVLAVDCRLLLLRPDERVVIRQRTVLPPEQVEVGADRRPLGAVTVSAGLAGRCRGLPNQCQHRQQQDGCTHHGLRLP